MTNPDAMRDAVATLNDAFAHTSEFRAKVLDSAPEHVGTVRWFGRSWSAPVCEPAAHIATPVGATCPFDGSDIDADDRGIIVPGTDGPVVYHLACFLYTIGAR